MEDNKKVPSVEELMQQLEDFKKEKTQEVDELKRQLDEEKRKNAQFTITGLTKKVETKVESNEKIEFDFDF